MFRVVLIPVFSSCCKLSAEIQTSLPQFSSVVRCLLRVLISLLYCCGFIVLQHSRENRSVIDLVGQKTHLALVSDETAPVVWFLRVWSSDS